MNDQADLYDEDMHDQDPRSPDADKHEEMPEQTALLPKSICPDMQPGEELVLKIDKVMDKEYVVSYSPKEKSEPEPDGGAEQPTNDLYE